MNRPLRYLGQAALYGLFIALIGYFSTAPAYRQLAADEATIKLSLRHSGKLLGECHRLNAAELARLPATLRAPESCPRERSPLLLELEINDRLMLSEQLAPRGIHGDGMATSYRRLTVATGLTRVRVRLKDHLAQTQFPYIAERTFELRPAQVLAIDFDSRQGQFLFL